MNKEERKEFLFTLVTVIIFFMIAFALIFVGIGYLITTIPTNTPANHTTLNSVVVDNQRVDSVWVFKTQESN